ncbi:hypothetical protein BDZ97DRAFT_1764792 [Flammula alnicola]|nr:hypothetical protein BDZ97DRAFT_1764792 [Flammula alnicola]
MNKGFTSGVWPSDDKSHPQPQITPLHGLNDEELASTTKLPRDQAPTPSSDDDVQAAEAHNASAVVDEDSKCSEETPEPEAEAIHEEDVEVPSSPAMHTIFSWPPRRPQPKRLQRMSAAIKWPSSTMINRISKRALVVPPYTDLDSASTSTTTTTTRNRASASTIGSASTVGDASTSSKHRDIIFAIVAPNLIRQALTQPLEAEAASAAEEPIEKAGEIASPGAGCLLSKIQRSQRVWSDKTVNLLLRLYICQNLHQLPKQSLYTLLQPLQICRRSSIRRNDG